MSKAHDPHWRYIALQLAGPRPISRRSLQNALLGRARKEDIADALAPQLTRFEWPHAIVRVHHHQLAAAREWLPRIDFAVEGDKTPLAVETLSASGTIKTLTDRLGILKERGKKDDKGRLPGPRSGGLAPARSGKMPPSGGPARPPGSSRRPKR